MALSHERELSAIAFHVLAALEEYEEHVTTLVTCGWDADVYMKASDQFADLQLHCASLPKVQVPWVAVLISRFEFVAALWDSRAAVRGQPRLRALHEQHCASISELRQRCMREYTSRNALL